MGTRTGIRIEAGVFVAKREGVVSSSPRSALLAAGVPGSVRDAVVAL
jgi:hypothetical protein